MYWKTISLKILNLYFFFKFKGEVIDGADPWGDD